MERGREREGGRERERERERERDSEAEQKWKRQLSLCAYSKVASPVKLH